MIEWWKRIQCTLGEHPRKDGTMMKRLAILLLAFSAVSFCQVQSGNPVDEKPTSAPPTKPQAEKPLADLNLEKILTAMDESSASFKTAEVDFRWDQYQKVVDDHDIQIGKGYFRRQNNKDTQMAAEIFKPEKKQIVYTNGSIRFYQPKIDQVTEYDGTSHKTEIESFLVLGFGGRGHDLPKQFQVKLLGMEKIDGVECAKLELIPKSNKVLNMFARILLWIDTARDISLKQQAFEPSGDYRIAIYTNVKMNEKIDDGNFKLKTTKNTKVVHPQ
jgi:outer membrane lipoprotein-sorting protein